MGKKKRHANRKVTSTRSKTASQPKNSTCTYQPPCSFHSSSIRGLTNLGNTCFFNSSLQALNAVVDEIDESRSSRVYSALCATLISLRGRAHKAANPSFLLSTLSSSYMNFRDRRQHDAHELIIHLISTVIEEEVEEEEGEENKGSDGDQNETSSSSPFSSLFGGSLVSIVQCMQCNHRSCSSNPYVDISMQIPGSEHLFRPRGGKQQYHQKHTKKIQVPTKEVEAITLQPNCDEQHSSCDDTTEDTVIDNDVDMIVGVEAGIVDGSDSSSDFSGNAPPSLDEISIAQCPLEFDIEEPLETADSTVSTTEEISSGHGLSGRSLDIYSCLREFTKREAIFVKEGNGFDCSTCNSSNTQQDIVKYDASKRILLLKESLPLVLVLHLKRLLPGGKCTAHVQFPLVLDISAFVGTKIFPREKNKKMSSSSSSNDNKASGKSDTYISSPGAISSVHVVDNSEETVLPCETEGRPSFTDHTLSSESSPLHTSSSSSLHHSDQEKGTECIRYTLKAVISHCGGASGGHYVAYVHRDGDRDSTLNLSNEDEDESGYAEGRKGGGWYYTSDASTRSVSEQEVMKCEAYMLMYKRTPSPPVVESVPIVERVESVLLGVDDIRKNSDDKPNGDNSCVDKDGEKKYHCDVVDADDSAEEEGDASG